jgi:hypothetical protein
MPIILYLLQALLNSKTLRSDRGRSDHPSLVVKVGQDNAHTIALPTECVGHRDADLVKGDKCSSGDGGVCGFNLLRFDPRTSRDEDDGEACLKN